ncbi:MAG: sugar ABC transporter ATP-binding protein [Oscillospiraceae bacterium]|nr:sugar ABC transporter ATP-binding protein [Oscillospiraceae bacterium]
MGQSEFLFRAKQVYKSFGATKALKGVDLEIRHGEVLGLIGENGSGKSTLSSIIAAIQPADSGSFFLNGEPYAPVGTANAVHAGVCMILQEKGTFDSLSVASNIMINKEEQFSRFGIVSHRKMERAAQEALDAVDASHISAAAPLGMLSFEDRKLVELARAMDGKPKLLIVDETTTALSKVGRDILYEIIRRMRGAGESVLFISHDIDEVMEQCDRVVILRDGMYIETLSKEQFEAPVIKSLMVGREVVDHFYRTDLVSSAEDEDVLIFSNARAGAVKNVSFAMKKGEILGIGGLTDCGMHDIGRLAFGLDPLESGAVSTPAGEIKNPKDAMRKRIAYISKNRDQEALMLTSSIKDNICLASYPKLNTGPLVLPHTENQFVDDLIEKMDIRLRSSSQYVMELSGGNKQKVAIAKWLGFGADIFVLDCPTRGIDVGVKATFYELMTELKNQGKSILLISEELPEVIGMSDRVIIMKNGLVNGEFKREEELTEAKLIHYMV